MEPRKLNVLVGFFCYAGNSTGTSLCWNVAEWWAKTVVRMKLEKKFTDRIGWVGSHQIADTPITMTRCKMVQEARSQGADILVMVDSDMWPDIHVNEPGMEPFMDVAFDAIYEHYDRGPIVVAAPYGGCPPHENMFTFCWEAAMNAGDESAFQLRQHTREEARSFIGLRECAALPTGLIAYDIRAFDYIEHPYFRYEWNNDECSEKGSTEDVQNTRDISLSIQQQLGYSPLLGAFSSWAGHMKVWPVGRPQKYGVEEVSNNLAEAVRKGRSNREREGEVRSDPVPSWTLVDAKGVAQNWHDSFPTAGGPSEAANALDEAKDAESGSDAVQSELGTVTVDGVEHDSEFWALDSSANIRALFGGTEHKTNKELEDEIALMQELLCVLKNRRQRQSDAWPSGQSTEEYDNAPLLGSREDYKPVPPTPSGIGAAEMLRSAVTEAEAVLKPDHKTPDSHLKALADLVTNEFEEKHGISAIDDANHLRLKVIEIGSWKGDSAIAMADTGLCKVLCVDTFEGCPSDWTSELAETEDIRESFLENVGDRLTDTIWYWVTSSVAASTRLFAGVLAAEYPGYFVPADIIFIDADHSYESTKADIEAWLPHLRPGGVMIGHDFRTKQFPGVAEAVLEVFGGNYEEYAMDKNGGFWLYRKPEDGDNQ